MIPSTWVPHYRAGDGELVGYLDGADPTVTPRTLFGYPLAEGCSPADAVRVLENRGLACLGDRWDLVLVETEYGYYGPDSPRHTLAAPTGDRLTHSG
jgi:hypothetical protein